MGPRDSRPAIPLWREGLRDCGEGYAACVVTKSRHAPYSSQREDGGLVGVGGTMPEFRQARGLACDSTFAPRCTAPTPGTHP